MHTYLVPLFKQYESAKQSSWMIPLRAYWLQWVLGILLVFLAWRIFFFSRHPFWDIQPVFHYRNWTYWFYDHGILRKDLPPHNRFVNHACIQTYTYRSTAANTSRSASVSRIQGALPEMLKAECIALLRSDYNRSADVQYAPTARDVWNYFEGHTAPCFVSTYVRADPHLDTSTHQIQTLSSLRALITSRPMYIQIRNGSRSGNYQYMNVYYVDFLCVSKQHRRKNIAPEMIQTHEYNQSHAYLPISVSVFKREEELTSIVPIVMYNVVAYSIPEWCAAVAAQTTHATNTSHTSAITVSASATTCVIPVEGENAHIVLVTRSNFAIYLSALTALSQQPNIRFFLSANTANHLECIENGQWHVFMLLDHSMEHDASVPHGVTALYFFRNTCITWNGQPVLSLFASCRHSSAVSDALFMQGAPTCISILRHIASSTASVFSSGETDASNKSVKSKSGSTDIVPIPMYSILCVEYVGENIAFGQPMPPLYQSKMAYYFYNFAHRTFSPSQCFILA